MEFEKEANGPHKNQIKIEKEGPQGRLDFLNFLSRLESEHPGIHWLSDKTKEDLNKRDYSRLFLFAREKNKTLAVLIAEAERNQKSSVHARLMIVDPEYQRRGIGTTLLNYLKDEYLTINMYAYSLGIGLSQEDLYKFYVHHGFRRTDEESHHMLWAKVLKTDL